MNPRPPALALCCLLVVGVLGVLVLRGPEPATPVVSAAPVAEAEAAARPRPELRALRVLRAWDARRAAAWADGDPAALVGLYVAGSRTGRVDRAMLRGYADRGLRVTGLRLQLLSVSLLAGGRDRLRVLVTDRVAHAVARGHGHRIELPRDQPSTHRVTLRRTPQGWRVVEVGQPRAVARTASTSGSRNE